MGDHRLADRHIDLFSTPPHHSAAFYVYIFAFDYGGYSDMSRANVLICRRVREQRHGLRQFWGVVWGWGGPWDTCLIGTPHPPCEGAQT